MSSAAVVDASVIVQFLVERPTAPGLIARLESAAELHAPHLVDLEVLSVLRRLSAAALLSDDAATQALHTFRLLPLERYPHTLLRDRVWGHRHAMTVYDAAYVALADVLELPLLTCDLRLSSAHGHRAVIETFRPVT